MAEFDSDSEDDTQIAKSTSAVSKLNLGKSESVKTGANNQSHDSSSDSEDDFVRPKGRMAGRMHGNTTKSPASNGSSAFDRVSKALRSENDQTQKPKPTNPEAVPSESSDDDTPTAGTRRKTRPTSSSSESETNQTPPRSESPLFVSSPGEPDAQSDNEKGTPEQLKGNARFLSLVAQKRKEREEREKIEAEKKAARRSQMEHFSSDILSGEESGAEDPGSAHKLSQKARQPRKASKKALDEMRQETQRMSRNMQLAHHAQTKKKITKESLFARFNFMQPNPPAGQAPTTSSSTNNSQNSSDGEPRTQNKDTPHSSPARPSDQTKSGDDAITAHTETDIDADKGELVDPKDLKKAATQTHSDAKKTSPTQADAANPKRVSPSGQRMMISRQQMAQHQNDDTDSDDELEIVKSPAKCRRLAAFENLPTRQKQESPAMAKLKALAHLTSRKEGDSMTSAELSASLLRRARQQAAKERKERIEELRAKGVVIETAEERAAMENDMENLVEKARKEANEIARLERAAKKKNGNVDEDDDEDDDYQLSGSDEEGDAQADDEDEDENDSINGGEFVEQEADEEDDESETVTSDAEEMPSTRRKRPARVISDDEDEEKPHLPWTPMRASSHVMQSAERPTFPDMGTPGDMSLGLTQAFASTLDGNGNGGGSGSQPGSSTMPFSLPDPGEHIPQLRKEESEILVPDSQPEFYEKDSTDGYTQNIARVSESPAPYAFSEYSQSQLPDPTQDEGFVFSPFDPAKRFRDTPPMSTVDTVVVGKSQSPVADRKRKFIRRGRASELPQVDEDEGGFEVNPNAFNVMKKAKATKKQVDQYNKKDSKAKDIVDEAAEESEDEYAGLGGNSDESDGEENAIDRQMINDNSGEVVDEKQLAALNAYEFPAFLQFLKRLN